MAETIVLDPSEVATSRTQMDITPWVASEGIDWGDAEIAAYMADQARGSSPVDFRVPNRTVTIPLTLKTAGGTSFATARTRVQAKAAIFQREGGWIKRVSSSGSLVFADVVNATLKLGGGWGQAHRNYDLDANLVLETLPDFYGAEVGLSDHTEASATEVVFTEISIQGDYPARTRIVVDDDEGQTQLGLLWSLRSRHYSSVATAAVRYEAEALTPLDTAVRAALSGASGGTVVTHGTLATNWTPVISTDLGGTAFLTHTGTNRLFARYRTTAGTAVQLRAVWDVGDLTLPVENTSWRAHAGTAFYIADLGEVRLDPSPVGAHRWQAQIQGRGNAGTEDVSIDKLWVLNVDEGFGKLTAPFSATTGLATYVARDEFNQTAGDLAGKTLQVGGVWSGAGDANDFAVETTGKTAQRTAVSDTTYGRFAYASSTNRTDIVVQADFKRSATGFHNDCGVIARAVDVDNYLLATHNAADPTVVTVGVWISGAFFAGAQGRISAPVAGTFYTIRLAVDAGGRYRAWFYQTGAVAGLPVVEGQHATLATGGALATGKIGMYDGQIVATANTRNFNNFIAHVPAANAVIFPNRTVQLTTDGMRRLDINGVAYGPVSSPTGDLPRLPVAGLEGRTTEVFVKTSRGDFDQLPDTGIDNTSTQVYYRPCWLFVP